MNQSPRQTPPEGEIILDNQRLQVVVFTPSGRFTVLDQVSGACWELEPGQGCGALVVEEDGKQTPVHLGMEGDDGVLFDENYYMTRSTDEDDIHDVSLSGSVNSSLKVTVRYLLSDSFSILDCFCYVDGDGVASVKEIEFPFGPMPKDNGRQRIFAPRDLQSIQNEEGEPPELFEPEPGQDHRIVGAPFYVSLCEAEAGAVSGMIGYLQHPLSRLNLLSREGRAIATPSSSQLDETGKTEGAPYLTRFQFEPIDDLKALSWLARDQMLAKDRQIHLY